ncbi:MAG: sigma-70 family RNA polymerase sigma factor [Candidatus Aminicenantes bacterium]|nr:sigma-70 family RNA polymerase sigma factor [Candidatus Aminicenantes bacterium]
MITKGAPVEEIPSCPEPSSEADASGLLVARVQNGDRRAFREFIEKYRRLVAAIVFRMVRDAPDREELCQEVFLKIFSHIGRFQGGAAVSSWIGRIAANTCINHLRKKRLPLYDDLAAGGPGLENVAGDGPDPGRLSEEADLSASLQREIERLPPHHRLVLTLFHFSGMNYEEIGQTLKMPAGTVKSHLFRARTRLRWRLQPALREET